MDSQNPMSSPKSPEVNFDEQMVIAVFRGECPYQNYSTEIKSLNETNEGLEVLVEEKDPLGEVMSTAVSYPYHIIKTASYDGEISFRRI